MFSHALPCMLNEEERMLGLKRRAWGCRLRSGMSSVMRETGLGSTEQGQCFPRPVHVTGAEAGTA